MMNSEFAFIRSIMPARLFHKDVIQGIGDDAALLRSDDKYELAVACDMLVEDVHFKKKTLSPYDIGYKSLAVNLSDLAAMGAIPKFYLISIAIPKIGWTVSEMQEIYRGMNELAEKFQLDLVGGDTVSTKHSLVISVTVIGQVEKKRHLLRSNAKHGDIVFVTGHLGASAAGLSILQKKGRNHSYREEELRLVQAHQRPHPQIDAGRLLAQLNFRIALNDISDGIANEAFEIAEASEKRLVLDDDKIPKHPDLRLFTDDEIESFVLYGGEDFQLLGCVAEKNWTSVKQAFEQADIPIAKIGHVEDGEPAVYLKKNGNVNKLEQRGYDHFKNHE